MTTLLFAIYTVDLVGPDDGVRVVEVPKTRLNLFNIGYPDTDVFLRYERRKDAAFGL